MHPPPGEHMDLYTFFFMIFDVSVPKSATINGIYKYQFQAKLSSSNPNRNIPSPLVGIKTKARYWQTPFCTFSKFTF